MLGGEVKGQGPGGQLTLDHSSVDRGKMTIPAAFILLGNYEAGWLRLCHEKERNKDVCVTALEKKKNNWCVIAMKIRMCASLPL